MNATLTRAKVLFLALACSLACTACSSSGKMSRAQAQQLWHALMVQSDPANPSAIMGVPEDTSCPQGGHQTKRLGLLSVRGDSLQLRASLHYAGCKVSNTEFDGELFVGIRSSNAARNNNTSHYDSTLTGEVITTGTIPAHCAVDLSATRTMTNTNQPPQYTGTFCGYDAATLGI